VATPVEDQIHRHYVEQERLRCEEARAEWDAEPVKRGKRPELRDVPKPFTRPGPQSLCQDTDFLALVVEFDYDITDPVFQSYCIARGRLHVAGVPESRRWEFFRDHSRTKGEFLSDPYFHFAKERDGKQHEYTPDEMEGQWHVVMLGRAALQDTWELFLATQHA
jgi:hypothetical protein